MPREFQPLADAIYRDRVLRARRTPPEERILQGPLLFDYGCAIIMAGRHSENPKAAENELRQLLRQRLALVRKFDEIRASTPLLKLALWTATYSVRTAGSPAPRGPLQCSNVQRKGRFLRHNFMDVEAG